MENHNRNMPNCDTDNKNQTDDSLRKDLDAGIRFLHFMSMQTKYDVVDVISRLFALTEEMVANGLLDLRRFDERRLRLREKEESRVQEQAHVQITDIVDKYKIDDTPQIDCRSRIHLCKARCCTFVFPLSFRDLDERIIQWDYSTPYKICTKRDGYCVHYEKDVGCLVYENRPAICRTFDCRNDNRIWVDFERRIPATETDKQNGQEDIDD